MKKESVKKIISEMNKFIYESILPGIAEETGKIELERLTTYIKKTVTG